MRPDRDLDRELRDLGPHVEYPPAPDLARSVRERLDAEENSPEPSRSGPQLWWIAAAALVLLVAVPAFSLAIQGLGGGGSSVGGSAGRGGVAEKNGGGAVAEREAASSMAAESGASAASAEAACGYPEPILEARPSRGRPGDEFSIRGKNLDANLKNCNDDPVRDVRVEFLQGGRTWELGRVEADGGSRIAAKLEVPADAGPGRATVRATYGQGPSKSRYGETSAEARFFVLKQ